MRFRVPMSKHITLTTEQLAPFEHIKRGGNALITGSAGTGKSELLKAIRREIDPDLPVVASTGIAAVHVGGLTIHSWAGLGLAQDSAAVIAKKIKEQGMKALRRIQKAKRLAIDEVSMIHGELFTLIDHVFRLVRDEPNKPFGGMQLILFGDFLQLPPVSRDREQQAFAFESPSWAEAQIETFRLTKVWRQKDQTFSDALNHIRFGRVPEDVNTLLRSRYRAEDTEPETEPVIVYTHNADVDRENHAALAKLKGKETTFSARDSGEYGPLESLRKHCLAPELLRLKIGAQVMLLWNLDPLEGLANGSLGKVEGFTPAGHPMVKFRNGERREIERQEWTIKSGHDVIASREQYPLRLAYAITVHKSQGMTLDKIRVHLDKAFEYGQAYVALSRVKTLDGLFIASSREGCIKAHPSAVAFYEQGITAGV